MTADVIRVLVVGSVWEGMVLNSGHCENTCPHLYSGYCEPDNNPLQSIEVAVSTTTEAYNRGIVRIKELFYFVHRDFSM